MFGPLQICRQRIYGPPDLITAELPPRPSTDGGRSLVSVALGLGVMAAAWGAWTQREAITAKLQLVS